MQNLMTRVAIGVAVSAIAASSASADCRRLVGVNDPTQPNAFTLTFDEAYGGTRVANITQSQITLEICDDGTARFVDYYQECDSLTLPGGFETGALTILISDSQPQNWNPSTGEFTTSDLYAIHFEGDLSAFGIGSPFVLPGSSGGVVTFDAPTTGRIGMNWEGGAALPNPFDPTQFIPFTYSCQVNLSFEVDPGCATNGCSNDLDGDCTVGLSDLSVMLANFGTTGPRVRPLEGDTNRDLSVDLSDLAAMLSQFGSDCN